VSCIFKHEYARMVLSTFCHLRFFKRNARLMSDPNNIKSQRWRPQEEAAE